MNKNYYYTPCAVLLFISSILIFLYWNVDYYNTFRTSIFPIVTLNETVEPNSTDKNDNETTVSTPNVTKVILFWTSFFGRPQHLDGLGQCPELNCMLTNDRSYLNQSSALIFHMRDFDWNNFPRYRYQWQRYVFELAESPHHTFLDLRSMAGRFNWTMTYRLDSDIPIPYGSLTLSNDDTLITTINKTEILGENKKLVVWMVTNCATPSKRERYVEVFKKYIPIDIYGECPMAKYKCPKEKFNECNEMIGEKYKFHLAFENSVCKDYITEKFYSRIRLNSIPIVLSRKMVENILPPHSFIAAEDFTHPKYLASYLIQLSKNDTEYLRYFSWKTLYTSNYRQYPGHYSGLCLMCQKLLNVSEPVSIYNNLDVWWTIGKCDTNLVKNIIQNK